MQGFLAPEQILQIYCTSIQLIREGRTRMKQLMNKQYQPQQAVPLRLVAPVSADRKAPVTRFGDAIDVRNRGALKMGRFAGSQAATQDTPAVVRLWTEQQCRELSAHQARALAAQLLAAALLADMQNSH